jgi:hypothetical protein
MMFDNVVAFIGALLMLWLVVGALGQAKGWRRNPIIWLVLTFFAAVPFAMIYVALK